MILRMDLNNKYMLVHSLEIHNNPLTPQALPVPLVTTYSVSGKVILMVHLAPPPHLQSYCEANDKKRCICLVYNVVM